MSTKDLSVNDDEIVIDGNTYDRGVAEAGMSLLSNSRSDIDGREDLFRRMGRQYDGDRDIHEVLGYPDEIESEDYRAKYERLDVATRIVELPADDTWRQAPRIIDEDQDESQFEKDIETIDQNARLFHYLRRLDVVSGIGEYGLLLIGLKDGQSLDEPPAEGTLNGPDDVAFFTPFAQDHVEDWQLGKHAETSDHSEPGDERYNRPVKYQIDFNAFLDEEDIPDTGSDTDLQWVHWRRVVHVAEGKTENDLRGTPRQKPVYNRLIDYEKVIGASAEMFWTGAAPRFHFDVETDSSMEIPTEELDKLDDEVNEFVHDMQSYLKTFNTDVEVIGGQEVDPTGVLDNLYAAFSGQTGIPQRILKGSERGELASSQDRANWFDRIRTRQHRFAEPEILRKVIDRFKTLGLVDEPTDASYTVEWPNLFELNEVEKSEVMLNRANVPQQIAPYGNTALLPGKTGDWISYIEEGDIPEELKEMDADTPDFDDQQRSGEGNQSNNIVPVSQDDDYEQRRSVNSRREILRSMNAKFERGQKVTFEDDEAVIQDIKTETFEDHQGEEIEASEDDPQYILVTMNGLAYATEDDITDEEWEVDEGDPDEELAEEQANNIAQIYHDVDDLMSPTFMAFEMMIPSTNAVTISDVPGLDDPGIGFDSWPDSWEESDTPARLIALDAWTSMGAQFDCGGGCCKGTMMSGGMSNREANKFCASFKDEMLLTTHWRNRF